VDRSKNSALIPPGFGTPTSYLPGSGELLTPNLAANGPLTTATVTTTVSSGTTVLPPTSITGTDGTGAASASAGYTEVTSDLYYSGDYLGTLKIPSLNVNVKIYQGTTSTQLAKGAGHFTNTSIWDGNVCVAAHNRGTNSYFGQIHNLNVGDTITLTTKLGTRTYPA
jgi:sortase A